MKTYSFVKDPEFDGTLFQSTNGSWVFMFKGLDERDSKQEDILIVVSNEQFESMRIREELTTTTHT